MRLADALTLLARWLIWPAIVLSMTTPRIEFGAVHVTAGDVLATVAALCWVASWAFSSSRSMTLRAALWPSIILLLGAASAVSSLDVRGAGVGLVEVAVLWVLPALALPNLLSTPASVSQFLTSISVGSVIAGTFNLFRAGEIGIAGGLPQVWGAVQYLQGYFQVIGLTVAVTRLVAAIGSRRLAGSLIWCAACSVNASALVLTQTRGAWLAAIVAMMIVGLLWRPSVLLGTIGVLTLAGLAIWGADWGAEIRERVLSIFTLEAGLSGFESSLGRLALVITAWNMFLAHPFLGVGLRNFPIAMPLHAPPGMPLEYDMGPDRILTAVEGPHSTYMSLLSEVGMLGLIALACWQLGAIRRLYRESRPDRALDGASQTNVVVLLAAVAVVAVYNCFFELLHTGVFVLVSVVALGYRARPQQRLS